MALVSCGLRPPVPADPVRLRRRRAGASLCLAAPLSLVVLEALALFIVCSHQVHRQEVRRTLTQVEELAFADCLQYVTGSTIASCKRQFLSQGLR